MDLVLILYIFITHCQKSNIKKPTDSDCFENNSDTICVQYACKSFEICFGSCWFFLKLFLEKHSILLYNYYALKI